MNNTLPTSVLAEKTGSSNTSSKSNTSSCKGKALYLGVGELSENDRKRFKLCLEKFGKQFSNEYQSPAPVPFESLHVSAYSRDLTETSQWQCPKQIHVTTRFLGDNNNSTPTQQEINDFGTTYTLYATHIVYVQDVVVCLSVNFYPQPPTHAKTDTPFHITLAFCAPWRYITIKYQKHFF